MDRKLFDECIDMIHEGKQNLMTEDEKERAFRVVELAETVLRDVIFNAIVAAEGHIRWIRDH